jgi:hypothetical protein
MIDEKMALLRAHRNNIHRYRRLLATKLSELERAYILKRLREEEAASEALVQSTLPGGTPFVRQPAAALA